MLQDLRYAVRLLVQNKAWTLVVVVSIALGIGANTALFSAVNGLLFKTIGVADPDSLVRLKYVGKNDMGNDFSDYGSSEKDAAGREIRATFSYPMYRTLQENSRSTLVDLAAGAPDGQLLAVIDGHGEIVSTFIASGNFYQVLGVPALIGRTLRPEDDRSDAPAVGVISDGFWKRRFGGSGTVLGTVIRVGGVPLTIVGVTAASFTGIQQAMGKGPDLTVPVALDAKLDTSGRLTLGTSWWLQVVGRLKAGVTLPQVAGSLDGLFQQTARAGWTSYFASLSVADRAISRYRDRTAVPSLQVGSARRGIYDAGARDVQSVTVLSVVVAVLLLIVCANVANLLLSRATARSKEISLRLSLGATRSRLIRQLLTESVVLAGLGGSAGAIVGYWSRQLLPLSTSPAPFDWRLFGFVSALTVATGLLFGIAPALRATRFDLNAALKDTSRGSIGARTRLSKALLVAQVAMSLVLLVGAGLFLNTLHNLRQVDVGFDTMNLMLFRVSPALAGYDKARTASLYDELQERLAALPGVQGVGFSQPALLSGGTSSSDIFIEGHEYSGGGSAAGESTRPRGNLILQMTVSPSFFATLGIPLRRGRALNARDDDHAPRVVVINEAAARTYFAPGENPIGMRFGNLIEKRTQIEIVGIVGDVRYNSVRDAAPPTMYFPLRQRCCPGVSFELRTAADPAALVNTVRETVRRTDPNVPIVTMTTQAEQLEGRIAQEKLFAQANLLFGVLAVALAAIGLFGLMSYNVARRTNEIGVRMALGARHRDVVAMVMKESMAMVAAGIAIGVAAAFAAGRLVSTLLFGLVATDPLTIALATALMIAVSTVAGYLPARRAAAVDPMVALRDE
jgi:predicted permease